MRTFPTYDETQRLCAAPARTVAQEQTDANGHLNVRHYLGILDDAEWVVYEDIGAGAAATLPGVGGLFALEQHLTYRREVVVGEEVSVRLRLLERTDKLLLLVGYLLNHSRREVAAAMESLCAYVDYTTRRSRPLPGDAAAALDRVIAEHAALPWTGDRSGCLAIRR